METEFSNNFGIDADQIKDDDMKMKEARATCSRCKQGFCTSHGTKLGAYKERAPWAAITQLPDEEEGEEDTQEEECEVATNPNQLMVPRICKNEGCGKTFTEDENHSTACHYHRGPISFSHRSTGEHKVLHEFCGSVVTYLYRALKSSQLWHRARAASIMHLHKETERIRAWATSNPCKRKKRARTRTEKTGIFVKKFEDSSKRDSA